MLNLKRSALSVALAAIVAPGWAIAQTAQADAGTEASRAINLDTVQVTGIRRAIEASIDTKQSENTVVEAISAEDIGKLPDASIADSLARLPGLTAQRFGGRPQEINIRGFAGDFSTALLNGREQVSLGNNRGVEFDQYPSELMSQVVVHKTTSADMVGQGLSGTVNLKTVRPLAFGERTVAVNVRGDMNELDSGKEYGSRYSISYIDQFADDTVGIAIGYARMDNPIQGRQYEAWGFTGDDNGVLGGAKYFSYDTDNVRDGVMGVLEFKPNDSFSSTLDLFYSKFDKEEYKRGLEMGLVWGNGSTLVDSTTSANGTAVDMQWENVRPIVVRNDYNGVHDKLFALGWRNELVLSDYWKLTTDVSYSRAERKERILETYANLLDEGTDSVRAVLNPRGWFDVTLGQDYGNPALLGFSDPGGWGGERAQAGYLKDFDVKDTLSSIRFDVERVFDGGFISSIAFGANHSERDKSRASFENTLCVTAGCVDNEYGAIPAQYIGDSSFGFAGIPSILRLNSLAMLNDGVFHLLPKVHQDIANKNWEMEEESNTAYFQVNINGDLGPVPVRGNVGVQAVHVKQNSVGIASFEGVPLSDPSQAGASFTHYLPSLNLSFQLPAEQYLRVGASRQMARPRMDDLRANANFYFDQTRGILSGDGGNPTLKPWLADAYDLSWEKYFGGKGYVSAAYFYKDLNTYIYNQTRQFDFSQLPLPPGVDPGDLPSGLVGEFSQPANGEGGKIHGYELAVSVPLELLWAPLEGFGITANYSDTTSKIEPNGPGTTEPLPGLSKYVSNITAYYERYGFSARVSQRNRSAFLGEVQGAGGDRTKIYFEGETVTDLQLGYTFQTGPLENLSILLQVNNLENEPFRALSDNMNDRPSQYYEYGRTYLLGLNYRF
ncbi:TonB-dependent receptor [Flavobacterium sp. MXW15]|uniref:TonB-dependent receptor n=1 Tax=Xanthomonas chitinilytica TaxID=2989819 RepID=A0ABT3JR27_9XANT|nr:TonB-dependent receptor [Xanthomonas sp. H13-6]MCW4453191.1 TonB-dependent receptor [Flavobacterium sp. MXW15]MCW4470905.1 TonB-dependent receptor [Xanthomonas sp. H13-6]